MVVGALAALQMVPVAGLVSVPVLPLVGVAAVASLWGAITALLLASLADNAVEGIAVSKFFGFLVMIPVAAVAVAPAPWSHLAGVFPAYWPALALVRAAGGEPGTWVALAVGVAYQAVVLAVLVRRFLRRAD